MSNRLASYHIKRSEAFTMPYELEGPRGARYGMVRNVPNPKMLFVVNLRRMGVVQSLGWFSEDEVKAALARQEATNGT